MWNQKHKSYSQQLREQREELFGKRATYTQPTCTTTLNVRISNHKRIAEIFEKHGQEIVDHFKAGWTFDEIQREYKVSHGPVKGYIIKEIGRSGYEKIIIDRINAGMCGGKGMTLRLKNRGLPCGVKRSKSRAQ